MKKLLRYSLIALGLAFAGFFAYANLRPLSVTERLEPVALATWHVNGTPAAGNDLSAVVKVMPEVTACAVNKNTGLLSVTYKYRHMPADELESAIEHRTGLALETVEAAPSGGCPVHRIAGWYHGALQSLRIH